MIDGLLKLLEQGHDSAELRFGLANAYLRNQQYSEAIQHLQQCLRLKPDYSAAWKLLGKAQLGQGDQVGALRSYQQGLDVAKQQGDVQAEKEIRVFLKRLQSSD